MKEIITKIMDSSDKKNVKSCCKKILKKCSFNSNNDLKNVKNLATWLYIYGEFEEAICVCELLNKIEFAGDYDIWHNVDFTYCLKARILREQGNLETSKQLVGRVNEHRHPELYANLVQWYRLTLTKNITSEEESSPRNLGYRWRLVKIQEAIMNREAGGHPIQDEEFDNDIKEIVDILKQLK